MSKRTLDDTGYVADRRQYGSTGKRTGGGWMVVYRTSRGYEEGGVHHYKRDAYAALRQAHEDALRDAK